VKTASLKENSSCTLPVHVYLLKRCIDLTFPVCTTSFVFMDRSRYCLVLPVATFLRRDLGVGLSSCRLFYCELVVRRDKHYKSRRNTWVSLLQYTGHEETRCELLARNMSVCGALAMSSSQRILKKGRIAILSPLAASNGFVRP